MPGNQEETQGYLFQKLGEHGTKVFNQLCENGCDREFLGWYLALLSTPKIEYRITNKEIEDLPSKKRKRSYSPRPLDAVETAFAYPRRGYPDKGHFTRRQIGQIAKRAEELR